MTDNARRDLPKGITAKTRMQDSRRLPVTIPDGTPVYRVRMWDLVLNRQIERTAEGLDAVARLLADFNEASDALGDCRPSESASPVMIPDIALPAVCRLADRGASGRERSGGQLYTRLINGDRGGYLG